MNSFINESLKFISLSSSKVLQNNEKQSILIKEMQSMLKSSLPELNKQNIIEVSKALRK